MGHASTRSGLDLSTRDKGSGCGDRWPPQQPRRGAPRPGPVVRSVRHQIHDDRDRAVGPNTARLVLRWATGELELRSEGVRPIPVRARMWLSAGMIPSAVLARLDPFRAISTRSVEDPVEVSVEAGPDGQRSIVTGRSSCPKSPARHGHGPHQHAGRDQHPPGRHALDDLGQALEVCCEALDDRRQLQHDEVAHRRLTVGSSVDAECVVELLEEGVGHTNDASTGHPSWRRFTASVGAEAARPL